MGDWPLLTDEQRMTGTEALVKAGLRVIVGTGAQNPMRAAALAAHAKRSGAAGLMVIPRVLSRGSSASAQYAHFAGILEVAVDLPAVIYNSPYYGFETKAELFFALHEKYPHLVGFKEFGSAKAMSYAAEHITGRSESLSLMVGVDTEVFHGYVNCGATGAITGIGNVLPREVLHLVALCQKAASGDAATPRNATITDKSKVIGTQSPVSAEKKLEWPVVFLGSSESVEIEANGRKVALARGKTTTVAQGQKTVQLTQRGKGLASVSVEEPSDRFFVIYGDNPQSLLGGIIYR
jgi:dihydrodipicolinate synthase/N-acetylneuraminate lyase